MCGRECARAGAGVVCGRRHLRAGAPAREHADTLVWSRMQERTHARALVRVCNRGWAHTHTRRVGRAHTRAGHTVARACERKRRGLIRVRRAMNHALTVMPLENGVPTARPLGRRGLPARRGARQLSLGHTTVTVISHPEAICAHFARRKKIEMLLARPR